MRTPWTTLQWLAECGYIDHVTEDAKAGRLLPDFSVGLGLRPYTEDVKTLLAYCEMQRAFATSDRQYDTAEYIGHCIDDINEILAPSEPAKTKWLKLKPEYATKLENARELLKCINSTPEEISWIVDAAEMADENDSEAWDEAPTVQDVVQHYVDGVDENGENDVVFMTAEKATYIEGWKEDESPELDK